MLTIFFDCWKKKQMSLKKNRDIIVKVKFQTHKSTYNNKWKVSKKSESMSITVTMSNVFPIHPSTYSPQNKSYSCSNCTMYSSSLPLSLYSLATFFTTHDIKNLINILTKRKHLTRRNYNKTKKKEREKEKKRYELDWLSDWLIDWFEYKRVWENNCVNKKQKGYVPQVYNIYPAITSPSASSSILSHVFIENRKDLFSVIDEFP